MGKNYNKMFTEARGTENMPPEKKGKSGNESEKPKKTEPGKDSSVGSTEVIVSNCVKLNVREQPNKLSTVLCVLDDGDVLTLDDICDDWALIYTVNGIKGYVMKEFIKHKH